MYEPPPYDSAATDTFDYRIRTATGLIAGYAELLRREMSGLTPDHRRVAVLLDHLENGVDQARQVVSDDAPVT